jgi:basic membrane protein A
MFKKRISLVCIAIMLTALLLAGCKPAATPVPAAAAKPIKVALVLSGPISDASWNAAAYSVIMGLKSKYNLELQYSENVGLPDIEPVYRDYASKGVDVIIAHGFEFGDPAVKIAPEYPNTKFGIIEGAVEATNVESLNFRGEEQGYLAGILAASMSKSGVIGGIGGEQVPNIVVILEAFKLGAKSVNPNIKVMTTYVGSWTDPTAGMEAANAQINNGVDVVYPIANLTSTGVYQAAKEKNVVAIGTEGDQCAVAPGVIKASETVNIAPVIEFMLADIKNGTFKGAFNNYGLKEGAISLIYCEGQVSTDIQAKVDKVLKQIMDGTLQVPVIFEPTK